MSRQLRLHASLRRKLSITASGGPVFACGASSSITTLASGCQGHSQWLSSGQTDCYRGARVHAVGDLDRVESSALAADQDLDPGSINLLFVFFGLAVSFVTGACEDDTAFEHHQLVDPGLIDPGLAAGTNIMAATRPESPAHRVYYQCCSESGHPVPRGQKQEEITISTLSTICTRSPSQSLQQNYDLVDQPDVLDWLQEVPVT